MALELVIPEKESFDNEKQEFVKIPGATLRLEHSLVSLLKWEQKHKKPYLKKSEKDKDDKTPEEILDYIKCMTINRKEVPDIVYMFLTREEQEKINAYIVDPMTATYFNVNTAQTTNGARPRKQEQITAELIYYWMFSYRIPLEWEKRHLNTLLTLIRVFSIKDSDANGKSNKMSKRDIMSQNRALNAARRQALNSKG